MFNTVLEGLKTIQSQFSASENTSLYVPLNAKQSLASKDEGLDLQQEVTRFLVDTQQSHNTLLLLGEGGSGKTLYVNTLHAQLWQNYMEGAPIPLLITLPHLENPLSHAVEETLNKLGFNEAQINELKATHSFIFILDGYDELHQLENIIQGNSLEQWNAKTLITCRNQYLYHIPNYERYFVPLKNGVAQASLFKQLFVAPFSDNQINLYIQRYEQNRGVAIAQKLNAMHGLNQLLSKPYLLSLIVDVLPELFTRYESLSPEERHQLTQITLYDLFMSQWFDRQEDKLKKSRHIDADVDMKSQFWAYCKDLSVAMHEEGVTYVSYQPKRRLFASEPSRWDRFFSDDLQVSLLRSACPIHVLSKRYFGFIHSSYINYFITRAMYEEGLKEESHHSNSATNSVLPLPVIARKSFTRDVGKVESLRDSILESVRMRHKMHHYINLSKTDERYAIAAANAITGLNAAKECFSGMDLSHIKIPDADLDEMTAHRTNFTRADLQGCSLKLAFLGDAVFNEANLKEVKFGELPYFNWPTGCVTSLCFSPDGNYLYASGDDNTTIIYDIKTGQPIRTLNAHRDRVLNMAFSPSAQYLATSSKDKMIRLWNLERGTSTVLVDLSADFAMKYSSNHYFPVLFSSDSSVVYAKENEVFETNFTGQSTKMIKRSSGRINKMQYSADRQWLGLGKSNEQIEIWNVNRKESDRQLPGYWLCFSPDHLQMAVAVVGESGPDKIVLYTLPDFQVEQTLLSHYSVAAHSTHEPGSIRDMQYIVHTDKRFLASSGDDCVIFLWNAIGHQTEPMARFSAHSMPVTSLAVFTDKLLLASGTGMLNLAGADTGDKRIYLWDVKVVSASRATMHQGSIKALVVFPDKLEILTAGEDGNLKTFSIRDGHLLATQCAYPEEHEQKWKTHIDSACLLNSDRGKEILVLNTKGSLKSFPLQLTQSLSHLVMNVWPNHVSLATSPDGKLLAVGSNENIKVYDYQTKALIFSKDIPAMKIVFSYDGAYTLACIGGNVLTVLDGQTGNLIYQPEELKRSGSGYGSGNLSFSPLRSQTIASSVNISGDGSSDAKQGSVMLWDIVQKKKLGVLSYAGTTISCLAYSSNGQYLAIGYGNCHIIIWDAFEYNQLASIKSYTENIQQSQGISTIEFIDNQNFITTQDSGSIQSWFIYFTNTKMDIKLRWRTTDKLVCHNASLHQVRNLHDDDARLFYQREAKRFDNSQEDIDELLIVANNNIQKNQLHEAIILLNQVITKDPTCAEAYLKRGICHIGLNDGERANQDWSVGLDCTKTSAKLKRYMLHHRGTLWLHSSSAHALRDFKAAKNIAYVLRDEEDFAFDRRLNEALANIQNTRVEAPRGVDRLGAIYIACQQGNFSSFMNAFKKEDANKKYMGIPLLQVALHFNHSDIVDALLSAGADSAIVEDQYERTALFDYIYDKETQRDMSLIIKLVKANQTVVNIAEAEGMTPLHAAVTFKDIELATYLLEQGANPNTCCAGKSPTPIISAIQQKDAHMLALLLKYQAEYAKPSFGNVIPLGYIASKMNDITRQMDGEGMDEDPDFINLKEMGCLLIQQYQKDGKPVEDSSWLGMMRVASVGHVVEETKQAVIPVATSSIASLNQQPTMWSTSRNSSNSRSTNLPVADQKRKCSIM